MGGARQAGAGGGGSCARFCSLMSVRTPIRVGLRVGARRLSPRHRPAQRATVNEGDGRELWLSFSQICQALRSARRRAALRKDSEAPRHAVLRAASSGGLHHSAVSRLMRHEPASYHVPPPGVRKACGRRRYAWRGERTMPTSFQRQRARPSFAVIAVLSMNVAPASSVRCRCYGSADVVANVFAPSVLLPA